MTTQTIRKILVANRGEIACRVMRTAKAMGIATVAVYSDADQDALHVTSADTAVHIGPSAVAESYLVIERIIEAAVSSECDAIHPGYGFLSENTAFALACQEAGLIFIGPSARAIELMGDKAKAKRAMIDADVPCIPGYQGEDQALETLTSEAEQIGYPLMIKAAAGGGGRGMRLVDNKSQLENGIETARSEALSAFGAGELILEKAIVRPRHVEVQVFGDQSGQVVYLGERDCSVQRRHQKVIEEAPCPIMTPELRAAMGMAAVAAAQAVDYVGAGTVEFLLAENGEFYFLEMNTRLQVEHPVTELITGLDLVELQIRVASGVPLGFSQDEVELHGHAMEVRLYAEDPQNDFLPSTGKIEYWHTPEGDGVRVDSGVESGSEVSSFYDPMLAKVIAYGTDRDEARRRLIAGLANSILAGPATNRDFLIDALSRPSFAAGEATTAFIDEQYGDEGFHAQPSIQDLALAAVIQCRYRTRCALEASTGINPELINWSSAAHLASVCTYRLGDDLIQMDVKPTGVDTYVVTSTELTSDFELVAFDSNSATIRESDGKSHVIFHAHDDGLTISLATDTLEFTIRDVSAGETAGAAAGSGEVFAPMHGQLLEVFVAVGDVVIQGQRLAVLEAMKMQHEITAEVDGTVTAIHVQADTQIAMDTLMIEISEDGED